MKKEEMLNELREKFQELKKQIGFKSSFEEINSMSFIEDMVLSDGYVSEQFSRQLINRMVQTPYSWVPQLHAWLMPSPYDIPTSNENKQLSEEDKKEIQELTKRIMYLFRKNKRIGVEKDSTEPTKEEGEFIDELVKFDKEEFTPTVKRLNKKFEDFWKKNKESEKSKGKK